MVFVFARIPIANLLELGQGSSRLHRVFPTVEPREQCWSCVQEVTKR